MNNQTRDIYEIFGINLKIVSFSSWILEFVKKRKKNYDDYKYFEFTNEIK